MTYQKLLFLISFIALVVILTWVTSSASIARTRRLLHLSPIPPTPIPMTPTPQEDVPQGPASSGYSIFGGTDQDENVNLSDSGGRGAAGIKGRATSGDEGKKQSEEGKRELPEDLESRKP
jgi:hypothetical protein